MDVENPQVGDTARSPHTGLDWEVVGVDKVSGVTVRRRRTAYRSGHGAIDDHGGYEQQTVPWSLWRQAFGK